MHLVFGSWWAPGWRRHRRNFIGGQFWNIKITLITVIFLGTTGDAWTCYIWQFWHIYTSQTSQVCLFPAMSIWQNSQQNLSMTYLLAMIQDETGVWDRPEQKQSCNVVPPSGLSFMNPTRVLGLTKGHTNIIPLLIIIFPPNNVFFSGPLKYEIVAYMFHTYLNIRLLIVIQIVVYMFHTYMFHL